MSTSEEPIFKNYRVYKGNSEELTNWLINTITSCGLDEVLLHIRMRNKKTYMVIPEVPNAKQKPPLARLPRITGYCIGRDDFPVFASSLYNSALEGHNIPIPLWVISSLEKIEIGRNRFLTWASKHHIDNVTDLDIQNCPILRTLNTLIRIRNKKSLKRDGPAETNPNAQNVNMLDYADTSDTADASQSKENLILEGNASYEYSEPPSIRETWWLIYCFFEDFSNTRRHLQDTWTTYKDGEMACYTAALSTNVAIQLFQMAEADFLEDVYQLEYQWFDSFDLMDFIKTETTKMGESIVTQQQEEEGNYNYRMFEIADWVCMPVYLLLKAYGKEVKDKVGCYGDLFLSKSKIEPCKKHTQDKIVLYQHLLPEFEILRLYLMGDKNPDILCQDELTRVILKFLDDGAIPILLVLALQVQLDIHYMLLDDEDRPQSELIAAGQRIFNSMENLVKSQKTEIMLSETQLSLSSSFGDLCKYWTIDDFLQSHRGKIKDIFPRYNKGKKKHVLLRRHPILCGMFFYWISTQENGICAQIALTQRSVACTLHLYNCLLKEGRLTRPWLDLEALIASQPKGDIFVGGRPDKHNVFSYIQAFEAFKKAPLLIYKCKLAVAIAFDKAYIYQPPNAFVALLVEHYSNMLQDHAAKLWKQSPFTLCTIRLLRLLENGIHEESFIFHLDNLSLHACCDKFLRGIYPKGYIKPGFDRSKVLFKVVGNSLSSTILARQGCMKGDEEQNDRLNVVNHLAECMSNFIEQEGDVEVEKVKALCPAFKGVEPIDEGDE